MPVEKHEAAFLLKKLEVGEVFISSIAFADGIHL